MKPTLTAAAKPIAILLLVLVAVHPLLRPTLPWSDDGQLHFWRVVELDHCLRNGYLYPRWMPDMAYGYGYPLLNYYAPLSVYLAEAFHLLGLDFTAAVLAAFSVTVALGALGAYLWARDAFGDTGGLIAAVAYAYAPYTLYNAVWRGNLAESLALGLLPWTFWRLRRLTLRPDRRNLALAALPLAALILSHNITAIIASSLLAGYALLIWLPTERSWKVLGPTVGALALGLALSAFFWLPAFFERDLVQTAKMVTTSHFDYRHNFLEPNELLSPPVPVDVTQMNPPVPRSLGWPALALAALGAVGSWKIGRPEAWNQLSSLRWEIPGVLAGLLLCASLTLPDSRFLWERMPLLPYAGFPWRFLGPASLMAAWLGGASTLWDHGWQPGWRALGVGLATLVIVSFSLTWLYPRYLEPIQDPTPANLIAFEQRSGALGTTSVGEYLPAAVKELPDTRALVAQYRASGAIRRVTSESLPPEATISSEEWRPIGGDVTIDSPRDWTATLQLFYFPGWQVWLNGAEVATMPSSPHGLLRFSVPAGETHIKIRFGSTPWRRMGTALSATGLAALVWITVSSITSALKDARLSGPHPPTDSEPPGASATRLKSLSAWVAALLAAGSILAVKVSYLDTHDSPVRHAGFDGQEVRGIGTPLQVHFDKKIRLLGYYPATLVVEAGSTLPLCLYWTADAPPDEEYSSFLHLIDADGHRWGQSDNQHPGGYPTVRWRPGEYNRDTHMLIGLPGTPPGIYILRAGLIGRTTGVGLDVLDERGAPAGTSATIGTVTVTRPQPLPIEGLKIAHELDMHFGDLTLLGMGLDRRQAGSGERLLLLLYWQAENKPSQDYVLSVEVTDSLGQCVAQKSLPLASDTYPTSKWITGEVVLGQHWLPLPAHLDSGLYGLSLQLLDPAGKPVDVPVNLGEAGRITVVAPDRQTTIPPMDHRTDANFGDRATLLGYDLEAEAVPVHLTLYWRAEKPMTLSYAVFAHLVDADSRIVAQHDGLPAGWTRPTTGWLPGEVIADAHDLTLPPNVSPSIYLLEVGLYDPETNARLPVLDAAGRIVADRVLLEAIHVEP